MNSPIAASDARCTSHRPAAAQRDSPKRRNEDNRVEDIHTETRSKRRTNPFNTLPPDTAASFLKKSIVEEAGRSRTASYEDGNAPRRVIDAELGMQDAGKQRSLRFEAAANEMQAAAYQFWVTGKELETKALSDENTGNLMAKYLADNEKQLKLCLAQFQTLVQQLEALEGAMTNIHNKFPVVDDESMTIPQLLKMLYFYQKEVPEQSQIVTKIRVETATWKKTLTEMMRGRSHDDSPNPVIRGY